MKEICYLDVKGAWNQLNNEEKVSRKTFHSRLNRLIETLERDIAEGVYAVGDFLPSETTLAERYKMGPRSIRKGIDMLVERGIVAKERRVGARVIRIPELTKATLVFACYGTIVNDFSLHQLLADFHAQHPSIEVKPIFVNTDYYNLCSQMLELGAIDVLTLNQDSFQDFVAYNKLSLLEPLTDPSAGVYRFLNQVFSAGEQRYVQPVLFSPLILCYNKTHFRENDLLEPDSTWTWNDMIKAAKTLTKGDRYGLHFDPLSMNIWPAWLIQNGVMFDTNDDGGLNLRHNDSFRACMRFYRDVISDATVFPPLWQDRELDCVQRFQNGQISMTMIGYSTLTRLKGSGMDYDISPLPFVRHPLTNAVSIGVAINPHAKQKEAAYTFLEYLRSQQAQKLICSHSFSIPAHKEVADSIRADEEGRPSRYNLFKETMPSFRIQQDLHVANWQLRNATTPLALYLTGQIDEEGLCERLERILSR